MVPNAGSNFGRTRLTSNGRRLAAAAATLLAVGVLPACGFLHPGKPQPSAAADAFGSTVTRLLHAATAEDASDHDASVDALAALGAPAVPHLAEALKDPDEKIRETAVETLTKMHGKEVVDALVQALKDQNEDIRAEAARGLGALPDRRAVQPLLDQFARDDNPQVRYECLTSLGLIGDPAAVDVLLKSTSDADPYVRLWALDALCQMKDPHAPALAIAMLQDASPAVREHDIQYCEDAFNTPDGHRTLIGLAIDADEFVTTVWARRHLMAYVDQNSGGPDLRGQMRAAGLAALHGKHAARAALLLGDLADPAATSELIRGLHDPDWAVRHHAAYLLARSRDRRAVPALMAALHDPVEIVAATACNSLLWFADDGDKRAQEAVRGYTGSRFNQRVPR